MGAAGKEPVGAWDLSYASYDSVSFSTSPESDGAQGIFFKPDGTKLYVVRNSGADDYVNEYDLSTAWDITTASYSQFFNVNAQEAYPRDLFFKADGTKMYVIGSNGDEVNEYNLSVAWDISTASYSQNFSVASQDTDPTGLFFKSDGTEMYITGNDGDDVNQYSLSSAWDISTASYTRNFSVASQETNPLALFFKPDGTKMFIVGSGNVVDVVSEYELSTAWDISTASYSQNFSIASQTSLPNGLFFKDNGTKMFIISGNPAYDIYAYTLG
jgi:hypothetical protein